MITTPLLEEKDRVQRELAQSVGYDVDRYFAHVHQLFKEMQAQYGFIPQYADLPGGPLSSVGDETLSGGEKVKTAIKLSPPKKP